MSSDFEILKSLVWCTELPSTDRPRESPVFLLNGNEWFFRFFLEKHKHTRLWDYGMHIMLKKKHVDYETFRVNFEVGFKNEPTLSLDKGDVRVSEYYDHWYMIARKLQSKLPSDYLDGNWIKFVFNFDSKAESLSKISNEVGQ